MVTNKKSLTEFLLARIAEDEEAARAAHERAWPDPAEYDTGWAWHFRYAPKGMRGTSSSIIEGAPSPDRVLAECEAKRQAIEAAWQDHLRIESEWGRGRSTKELEALNDQLMVVRYLAQPYANRPDFQEDWKE